MNVYFKFITNLLHYTQHTIQCEMRENKYMYILYSRIGVVGNKTKRNKNESENSFTI